MRTYFLSWPKIEEIIQKLYLKIIHDEFVPEIIVVIPRGGMIPGVILSNIFQIKLLFSIWVEKVDSIRRVNYFPDIIVNGKNILLVEDLLETGKSLVIAQDYLIEKGAEVKTLSLYKSKQSIAIPDYFYAENGNIVFPWERQKRVKTGV